MSTLIGVVIGALNENWRPSARTGDNLHGHAEQGVGHRAGDRPVVRLQHQRELLVAGRMVKDYLPGAGDPCRSVSRGRGCPRFQRSSWRTQLAMTFDAPSPARTRWLSLMADGSSGMRGVVGRCKRFTTDLLQSSSTAIVRRSSI